MSDLMDSRDPIQAALERFANAKPDPVFTAAFDTLRKGAPGLSETTCSALARSIAIKVAHGPEAKTAIAQRAALVEALEAINAERLNIKLCVKASTPNWYDRIAAVLDQGRALLTTIQAGGGK